MTNKQDNDIKSCYANINPKLMKQYNDGDVKIMKSITDGTPITPKNSHI